MKHGLKAYRERLQKTRFAVGRKPRRALPTVESAAARSGGALGDDERTRHIPAAVVREVYLRDEQQCTFVSVDGRRCAARHFIELDHVKPWAYGGESSVENLRLRCRAHNQEQARGQFGTAHMNAAVARVSVGARSRGDPTGRSTAGRSTAAAWEPAVAAVSR